jgi:hypothetical protein
MSTKSFETDISPLDSIEGTNDDMSQPLVSTKPVAETIVNEAPAGGIIDDKDQIGASLPHETPAGANAGTPVALLTPEDSQRFRTSWNEVQGRFVYEPRSAVQEADALVSEVIDQLTRMFANEHVSLEGQWKQGEDVSTEDLRQALLRYHSFFNRLMG